jgi:transcriptional regulator with XRE-family HTH domain
LSAVDRSRFKGADRAFGELVAHHRRRRGLNQDDLAALVEVSGTYISEVERGAKSPSLCVIVAIAIALEMTAAELLTGLDSLVPPLER